MIGSPPLGLYLQLDGCMLVSRHNNENQEATFECITIGKALLRKYEPRSIHIHICLVCDQHMLHRVCRHQLELESGSQAPLLVVLPQPQGTAGRSRTPAVACYACLCQQRPQQELEQEVEKLSSRLVLLSWNTMHQTPHSDSRRERV